MPNGNDIITAKQVVPQRAAVDSSPRRDAAEPIGRDFADLVKEARSSEPNKPQATEKTKESAPSSPAPSSRKTSPEASGPAAEEPAQSQLSFSAELPEGDDPAAFLIANAALSQTPAPTAGNLNLSPNLPTQKVTTAQPPVSEQLPISSDTPADTVVNPGALLTAPGQSQTTASQPTQLAGATEVVAATQAAGASVNAGASRNGATLTASTHLNPPADPVAPGKPPAQPGVEGGPGANRFEASLTRGGNAETAALQSGQTAQNQQTSAISQQAKTDTQSPSQAATAQSATLLAATPEQSLPSNANSATSLTTPPATAVTGSAGGAQPSTAASPAHAPPPALASAPQAAVQVYSRFVERFDGRAQQFQVRLDPPELGRVNVRIEIGADHRVHAVLATHDSNALADLLRGQRALEQSLADAGIDLAEDGIRFELSDNGAQHSSTREQDDANARVATGVSAPEAAASAETGSPPPRWSRSRINIVA